MDRELVVIGATPLGVDVPQTKEELEAGWRLKAPDSDGLLFDIKRFSRTWPIWVPIAMGGIAEPLDVLWIGAGVVRAVATLYGGCLQGYADMVIELPKGWVDKHGVAVGAVVTVEHRGDELGN